MIGPDQPGPEETAPMSLTEPMREAAQTMLDAVLMQTGDAPGEEKRAASVTAFKRLGDLAGEWVTTNLDEAGETHIHLHLDPILWGSSAVMLWLITELSACADISPEEIVAHARNYVDEEAERPPR